MLHIFSFMATSLKVIGEPAWRWLARLKLSKEYVPTSRNIFFYKDVAPRWASNHGPYLENYRDKLFFTPGDGQLHGNVTQIKKSKRKFLQKMTLTYNSYLTSQATPNVNLTGFSRSN